MPKRLTREYSKRLGVLTAEQLDAALARFDLGTLVDAEPAPTGLFGQNVLLESTRGRFVLRGCPHYDWQFPKERFFARLIHERTSLGSPWPYRIEEATDIFGWSFAIMPRLPGEPGIPEGREEGRSYAEALGLALARLHELEWKEAGAYDLAADSVRPYPVSQAERVTGLIRERVASRREPGRAGRAVRGPLRSPRLQAQQHTRRPRRERLARDGRGRPDGGLLRRRRGGPGAHGRGAGARRQGTRAALHRRLPGPPRAPPRLRRALPHLPAP
jgi:hypothetical protein